jgi:hypothetical protein
MSHLTKEEYTIPEARQEIARVLKDKVAAHSEQLRQLRERELRRTPMAKGEVCLLCAQLPRACTCLKKATAAEANREIQGFRSIASDPRFGGGKLTNPPKTAPRPGNGNQSASGVIPNAKAEPSPELPVRQAVPQKPVPGAVLPDDKKSKKTDGDEGSGGKIEKRDLGAEAKPAARPVGVAGQQPVGQGGGDAHKVPGAGAAALPKTGAPHPDTAASLSDVKQLAPAAAWKGAGLPKLKAALAGVKAKKAAPAVPPAAASAPPAPANAAPAAQIPDWVNNPQTHAKDKAQLTADKRAGGVGFLNSLISRFSRRAPAAADPTPGLEPAGMRGGPVQSQRFHGALPLRRGEYDDGLAMGEKSGAKKPAAKKGFALTKCAMCKSAEHPGVCKEEMPAPTDALSSANHNRRMLVVAPPARRTRRKAR